MPTLQERAAQNAAQLQQNPNPANAPQATKAERKRIPMTAPQRKLAVPELPGYHLHWMLGTSSRIAQAQAAGYEFVDASEVNITNLRLGDDVTKSGNTDLGSRVSIVAGSETGGDGQPVRLYLMKQRQEWYEEDQKLLQSRNDSVADTLTANFRQGTVGGPAEGETTEDMANRYVNRRRSRVPDFFNRNKRRA